MRKLLMVSPHNGLERGAVLELDDAGVTDVYLNVVHVALPLDDADDVCVRQILAAYKNEGDESSIVVPSSPAIETPVSGGRRR